MQLHCRCLRVQEKERLYRASREGICARRAARCSGRSCTRFRPSSRFAFWSVGIFCRHDHTNTATRRRIGSWKGLVADSILTFGADMRWPDILNHHVQMEHESRFKSARASLLSILDSITYEVSPDQNKRFSAQIGRSKDRNQVEAMQGRVDRVRRSIACSVPRELLKQRNGTGPTNYSQ